MNLIQFKGNDSKPHLQYKTKVLTFFKGSEFSPYHEINKYLFQRLLVIAGENVNKITGFWDPEIFLPLLYDQIEIIKRGHKSEKEILQHLENLRLPALETYVLISSILYFFEHYQSPISKDANIYERIENTAKLTNCIRSIQQWFDDDYRSFNDEVNPFYKYEPRIIVISQCEFEESNPSGVFSYLDEGNNVYSLGLPKDENPKHRSETFKYFGAQDFEILDWLEKEGFHHQKHGEVKTYKGLTQGDFAYFIYKLQQDLYFSEFGVLGGLFLEKGMKAVAKYIGLSEESFRQACFVIDKKVNKNNKKNINIKSATINKYNYNEEKMEAILKKCNVALKLVKRERKDFK